jgi:hypothetical protein
VVNDFYVYANMEGIGLDADVKAMLREGGRRILAKAQSVAESKGARRGTCCARWPAATRPIPY